MTLHHFEFSTPGGPLSTMSGETASFGPYEISDGKKNGVKEDGGGPGTQPTVRVSQWDSQSEPLGRSGYVAQVGPVYAEDPKNVPSDYRIDVEKADGSGTKIYFSRDFRMAEVPAGIIEMKISRIVSYDERSRTVTFRVGNRSERNTGWSRRPPHARQDQASSLVSAPMVGVVSRLFSTRAC